MPISAILSIPVPPVLLAENGFMFALRESTIPGVVICVTLLILSSFSWSVMVTKMRQVGRARREESEFLHHFRNSEDPLDIFESNCRYDNAPAFHVYRYGCNELAFQLLGDAEVDETFRSRVRTARMISPTQMEPIRGALERAAGERALQIESKMSILATAVSGAPFLGLLGTVWGVMDTFSGVASTEAVASLKDMAPGVSAALITTVIALLVAIPAMFGYNFLVNSIRAIGVEMDNFGAELSGKFERQFVNHGRKELTVGGPAEEPMSRWQRPAGAADSPASPDADLEDEDAPEAEPQLELGGGALLSS